MRSSVIAVTVAVVFCSAPAVSQEQPPTMPEANAEACRGRVLIPETFETVTEQVLDQPERTEIRTFPARYETVTQHVETRKATLEYRIIPAVYESVTEQVLIRPERTETLIIPAEYETYTEQVLIRQAYTRVELQDGMLPDQAEAGEVVSVEVPAEYKSVTRTRIVTPEQSETRLLPAEYRTVVKQVLVEPARVETVDVPAEYESIEVEQLVEPAREEVVLIPATYRTIETRVITGGGEVEWQDVICPQNLSREKIRQIQTALSQAGYVVSSDGVLGAETRQALTAFQRQAGLAMGQVTQETLAALGLDGG